MVNRRRVFISHAGRDLAWAEWVAATLRDAGFEVELDSWNWDVGDDFVLRMNDAIDRADRIVALFSTAYFDLSRYTVDELHAVFADKARRDRLVPLRIEPVQVPPLFRPLVIQNLYDLDGDQTRRMLLRAVLGSGATGEAYGPPGPPPSAGRRLPGVLPSIWNVPIDPPAFTGRDGDIVDLRRRLAAGRRVALHGIGGVGKTALAVKYAHLFAGDYDIVWWVDAEQAANVGDHFAALALALELATSNTTVPIAASAARRYLGSTGKWLVVFDNVDDLETLQTWLPEGPGHVLITSRMATWGGIAEGLHVDVLTRRESATLLRAQQPGLTDSEAERLAHAVGDLPLALTQAGGVLAETGIPVTEYLEALDRQPDIAADHGLAVGHARSLAATVRLSMLRLAEADPVAGQLLSLCVFLGSDLIPNRLFTDAPPELLPPQLAEVAGQRFQFHRSRAKIGHYGLGTVSPEGLKIHRLTQAILQRQTAHEFRTMAESLLAAAVPQLTDDPTVWPQWAELVPHLIAMKPEESSNAELRRAACRMIRYLIVRGETATVLPIATNLYQAWTARYGEDDEFTLAAANRLANAYIVLGRFEEARQLATDTMDRSRRVLGEGHIETIRAANAVASSSRSLGQASRSRDLYALTSAQCSESLGEDHPETIGAVNGLAHALRVLGQVDEARRMYEEVLARSRRALGDDHPATLRTTNYLSYAWHTLGNGAMAREVADRAYEGCRRVFGENHPETLRAANNLAFALHDQGQVEQAHRICAQALTKSREALSDTHPETLGVMNNLAYLFRDLRDLDQAYALCEDALKACRNVLGEDHPETLRSANNLAGTLRLIGRLSESVQLYEQTLDRRRRVLGEDYPETLRSMNGLAGALRAVGDPESLQRAEAIYRDAHERCSRVLGQGSPETLRSCIGLGYTLYLIGQKEGRPEQVDQARTFIAQTADYCEARLGPAHPVTVRAREVQREVTT